MKKYIIASVLSVLLLTVSCSKEEASLSEDFVISTNDEINDFIWKGLNLYYLWQEDVPTLADNRFSNLEELFTFFRGNESPEATFNSLLNRPGMVDRFSWIVDDYVALENSFQGINVSTGMEFGLVRYANSSTNIFGYVRYVLPNSSAETSGITRGMYFNTVNGTQLTDTNYRDLLFSDATTLSIGLAGYNSGNPRANNTTISLSKTEIQENPIVIDKIIEVGSKKIGYLMYNQFAGSYDQELNAT
jgi:carboxyl-terminal processing protease